METLAQFQFKTLPYKHQERAFELSRDREYFALFLEQGLGKTKITLDTAGWLFSQGKINRLLIVAPNGVHTNWARNEIPAHCPVDASVFVWDGPPGKRRGSALRALCGGESNDMAVLCMNIEALRTKDGHMWARDFLRQGPCLMVVDESTVIKDIHSQQTKAAIGLGALARYRRILTGTPVAHNPIDLYSQCKFLKDSALPIRTLTAFKASFSEEEICCFGGRTFKRIKGFRNLDKLAEMLADFSIRLEKKDCLDLPPKIYDTLYVQLTPEQNNLYKRLKDEALIQLAAGTLTTQNALGIMAKCMQITTGFVYNDDKQVVPIKNNRLGALMDHIEKFDGKWIIWCAFKANVEMIHKALTDKFGPLSTVCYYGETDSDDRDLAVTLLQNDPNCNFFVATNAAAKGLTLTSACNVAYYSTRTKLEDRIQSEDRCHRIGQMNPVTYTDLIAEGTVDERIVKILREKGEVAKLITDNVKNLANIL